MMTILAFIVTIGILVTIHEFGHFQVARWCNVKVLKFSIGFGKPLVQKVFGKDKTEFVLAAIPLGGFVKMLDERELKNVLADNSDNHEDIQSENLNVNYSEADLARAFNRQSVFKRIVIVLAGPVANLLLAILLYWLLFMQGVTGIKPIIGTVDANSLAEKGNFKNGAIIQSINNEPIQSWTDARWILLEQSFQNKPIDIVTIDDKQNQQLHSLSFEGIDKDPEIDILKKIGLSIYQPKIAAVIGEILPDSAAQQANFKTNDEILTINNVKMQDWEAVVTKIKANPNQTLNVGIVRNGEAMQISATPMAVKENNALIGRLGASVKIDKTLFNQLMVETHYSALQSMQQAVKKTWDTATFSLSMMGKMLTGQVSIKGISGPVTIATYAGESANLGIKTFLEFLALVSISIGVLNLLPIPVLDGGHLMYYIIELIKGSPVSENTMLLGQKIGFALLGLMMTIAIFNDFNRLITG